MKSVLLLGVLSIFGACQPRTIESAVSLNVETAQLHAETFTKNLFPDVEVNGPICMPEAVVEGMTQCSFSFKSGDEWKVGTLLCGNTGCREGEAPAVVAANVMPTNVHSGGGGLDNDFLLFWMLMNSGTTHYHSYDSWYANTPPAYRSVYYAPGYRPSVNSVQYYRSNYASAVKTNAGKTYLSRKSVSTVPTTTTKTSTIKPTSSTSTPTKTVTPKPVMPKPTTTRSSGFGKTHRSSGYSPSRSRR